MIIFKLKGESVIKTVQHFQEAISQMYSCNAFHIEVTANKHIFFINLGKNFSNTHIQTLKARYKNTLAKVISPFVKVLRKRDNVYRG